MWPAIIAGAASLGGGIINALGQSSTNNTNLEIMRETNAFNAEQAEVARRWNGDQAEINRQFQLNASNSQWQRGVADMEKAGINPMLAVSQGGASSPSGSQASGGAASGVSTRMENAGAYLGNAIAQTAGSAMSVAKGMKDLDMADSAIAAQGAQALASIASANSSNATAEAVRKGMPNVVARARTAEVDADATIAEAKARKARAGYDAQAAGYDAVVDRVLNLIGGASSAANVFRVFDSIKNAGKDQLRKDDVHLRNQGRFGAKVR